MDKKKILFCDNSLRELINFRIDIINHYASQGNEVILVAPMNMKFYQFDYSNIRIIPVTLKRSGTNPWADILYFNTLRKIYAREQPDYIFHYTIKPNIYGTLAARVCKIHSTAMIAGLGYAFSKGGIGNLIARTLYRIALRYTDHVMVLNTYNKDLLIKRGIVAPEKIILLAGGESVNLERFKN